MEISEAEICMSFSTRHSSTLHDHNRQLDGGDRRHGQKVVGAMPPSRPTGILLCQFFETVK